MLLQLEECLQKLQRIIVNHPERNAKRLRSQNELAEFCVSAHLSAAAGDYAIWSVSYQGCEFLRQTQKNGHFLLRSIVLKRIRADGMSECPQHVTEYCTADLIIPAVRCCNNIVEKENFKAISNFMKVLSYVRTIQNLWLDTKLSWGYYGQASTRFRPFYEYEAAKSGFLSSRFDHRTL